MSSKSQLLVLAYALYVDNFSLPQPGCFLPQYMHIALLSRNFPEEGVWIGGRTVA